MSMPRVLRDKYLAQLDVLITKSQDLLRTTKNYPGRPSVTQDGVVVSRHPSYELVDAATMVAWTTRCINVLHGIIPRDSPNSAIVAEFQDYGTPQPHTVRCLAGRLTAIRDDFRDGFLEDIGSQIEASIAGDYMGQAEQLLADGPSGKYDHVPAAVLSGAVLEKSLRALCERQTPAIPAVLPDGRPKMLNTLIDDLKKADVYNETKAKQLRAWAAIRNHAAHGEFDQFDRSAVQQMIAGIKEFLADSL